MADRHTLAINQADDFTKWLVYKGWSIEPTKGFYEVVRAKKDNRTFIAFKRLDAKVHLSVSDKDYNVVMQYICEKRLNRWQKGGEVDGKL